MANNKKSAAKARPLTAAQKARVAPLAASAFTAGTSRNELLDLTRKQLGPNPASSTYKAARVELTIGLCAAALMRAGAMPEGCNDGVAHARHVIVDCAGEKAKALKDGQRRRTSAEEKAYASARVGASGILSDAGVNNPDGKARSEAAKKRVARQTAGKADTKGKGNREATPTLKDAEAFNGWLADQVGRITTGHNKNAKVATPKQSAFVQGVMALARSEGILPAK